MTYMSERYDRIRRIRRERRRQRRQQRSVKKTLKNLFAWLVAILAAAILGYGFVAFGFQKVYMVGPSMEPTLMDGEKYTVNQIVYAVGAPDRYDIVAYKSVENQDRYYSIKRVIGLPGETVLIQNGQVYINGNPLSDCPIDKEIKTAGLAETALTLGENEYFVLGDDPDNSQDSRYLSVGNVKKNEILGRVKVD